MSTCLLPYIEASGCTQDSPHRKLKFYIELSWLFSTCIGLILFLLEIGVIFFVKFNAVGYDTAAYVTTAMLVPVLIVFVLFSWLIHRHRVNYGLDRAEVKTEGLEKYFIEDTGIAQPKVSMVNPSAGVNVHGAKNTKIP
ncbi:CRE-ORAI-1 protein [Aphelenchoides avenae]|nr:CRE-ORAI-1 protein [Aphelenchus avenae]